MAGVTVEREFRLLDESDDEFLLKIISEPKKGMKVAVPKDSNEYRDDRQEEVDELGIGDEIRATLISEDETNTAWRFEEVQEILSRGDGTKPSWGLR